MKWGLSVCVSINVWALDGKKQGLVLASLWILGDKTRALYFPTGLLPLSSWVELRNSVDPTLINSNTHSYYSFI